MDRLTGGAPPPTAADRRRWSEIAHAGMGVMNPIPPARLDEVLELLDVVGLPPDASVVDLGCGRGELLIRLAEARRLTGLGVDTAPALIAEARAAAAARVPGARLDFACADLRDAGERGAYDLAAALGASAGGYLATLRRLRDLARPGGLVLAGEGYWRREPSTRYLDALGARADELATYAGYLAAAAREGLVPLYAATASVEDFDRYEWRWSLNGEAHAAAHAGEPGVEDLLAWIRAGRRRYVELGGRETLGFGLFLFRRENAQTHPVLDPRARPSRERG